MNEAQRSVLFHSQNGRAGIMSEANTPWKEEEDIRRRHNISPESISLNNFFIKNHFV
jgi:hypothetical protein